MTHERRSRSSRLQLGNVLYRYLHEHGLADAAVFSLYAGAQSLLSRALFSLRPARRWRLRELLRGGDLRLNIGCGSSIHPGWINADLAVYSRDVDVVLDVRRPLPFATASTSFIFTEHLIEHFSLDHAVRFLTECYRVLRRGGAIRIITPDLAKYVAAYQSSDSSFPYGDSPPLVPVSRAKGVTPCRRELLAASSRATMMNNLFYYLGEHLHLYDEEELRRVLYLAGFRQVFSAGYRQGRWPELLLDTDDDVRRRESLVLEATK